MIYTYALFFASIISNDKKAQGLMQLTSFPAATG